MGSNMVYVIIDKDGNYIIPGDFISPTETEQGWHYQKLEGRDNDSLTFYFNKDDAEIELGYLKDLGYDFYLECINITKIEKAVSQ